MSAIRIKSSPSKGILPQSRAGAPLSSAQPRKGKGSPVPILIALAILGVAGFFGWKEFDRRMKIRRAHDAEQERLRAELERREREEAARLAAEEAARKAAAEAAKKKAGEEEPVVVEAPKVKEKSETEILLEEAAARNRMLAEIAEARKKPEARPLNGFGGIRFGEPMEKVGAPVKWGTVLADGTSVDKRGATFAVYGPELKQPFLSMGSKPVVWVTPKTLRPYRIEFSRAMALKGDARHDPETTNLVAFISKRYEREPFVLGPNRPERKGCEYVFPFGDGTISIVERGADLTFAMEREDLKKEALAEAETLRAEEKQVAEADGKALDSTRYPNGGLDRKKYPGIRLKDETPRAFCGIVFASQPPESATLVVPQKGDKGFFLDYVRAKCRPFRGFTRGRADIDPYRGGVHSVRLFSPGGEGGLDDREYFESVKATLGAHYKVTPKEAKKDGLDLPELTFTVGDLDIVFGPDARGGFYLNARNQVLAKMAETEPPQPRAGRKPAAKKRN